jgi:signal transduction histidine kinase
MSQPLRAQGAPSGPGSKPIATTLLELLALRGHPLEAGRAARALGLGEGELFDAPEWLGEEAIARLFVTARVEGDLARSIGHRLLTPDATGLLLLGLATPEKAYRRIQSLLPRERESGQWSIEEIGDGEARLAYRLEPSGKSDHASRSDSPDAPASRAAAIGAEPLCALRKGMLEAIPGLYGLLPARLRESTCLARGADACRYEVRWQREPRRGLVVGGAVGLGLSLGIGLVIGLTTAGAWLLPGVIAGAVAGGSMGRCVDLSRQLQAVAGARRGQLALLDQTDDLLASKIDALARVEAKLDVEPRGRRLHGVVAAEEEDEGEQTETAHSAHAAAHEIFATAGELERWMDEHETKQSREAPSPQRSLVREIREWAARIVGETTQAADALRPTSLPDLVARAVASARPGLVPGLEAEIDCAPDLPLVECEPVQIEQVVVALLRNAVEASAGLMEVPRVRLGVRRAPGGVELTVEDRGAGIDSSEVDEVFDPFFMEQPLGAPGGFGLPFCLRVIERHGGEMRIEAGDRAGTRVTVLLPEASVGAAQGESPAH